MHITQRLNNNFVFVESSKGSQMIVMGKGVGYKAYPGNLINESLIEIFLNS
ncbi:CAT RNA binding domain protein [Enterococcus faecalis 13-SD-W-01]|nr:CAT RNA binding domain protein [Enterococcus faecalis 13-SD-W-01]